ncbi:MAG: hypothetical protein ACT4O5_08935, partial [Gammaproteobacteria bacterium]
MPGSDQSQFRLLLERRFLPFFGAQALGAFNDNLYKNVLVILATYQIGNLTHRRPARGSPMAVSVAGFIVSLAIPRLSPVAPGLRIDWNPFTSTWANIRVAAESRTIL